MGKQGILWGAVRRGWYMAACLFLLESACAPTFAPPSRVAIGGMPEVPPVGSGHVRVHGGGQGSLGLRLVGGVAPGTALDVGVSGALAQEGMAMSGAALRKTLYSSASAVVVGMAGVAAGCGGQREGVGSCGSRFAWGGYMGLDLGYRPLDWLGLYEGSRVQWSLGDRGGPITVWQIHALGIQVDSGSVFASLEGGYVRYDSFAPTGLQKLDSGDGPHWSLGFGARW